MLAHLDDVAPRSTPWAVVRDLGRAAGSVGVGVRHTDVAPGAQATPFHAHGAEEELFYVLEGGGACVVEDAEAAELRAGDAVLRRPGGRAHAFVAGPGGLRFLAFGERRSTELLRLPRTGAVGRDRAWWPTSEEGARGAFLAEAALPALEAPAAPARPPWVVAADDVERRGWVGDATVADLGRALGSVSTGLRLVRVPPGQRGVTKHCHSAEEELFWVLDGSGWFEVGEARLEARPGHLLARPAGTRVAHTYDAGPDGLVLLAYGQRDPNDMVLYPETRTVYLRALGVKLRADEVVGA